MNPRDLIQTACRLTESAPAQPTQADLRRAVSTAYYALFHCLAAAAADLPTGARPVSPEWHQVYRALEHGKARSACRQQAAMRTFPKEIRSFAEAFDALQKARQQADYALEHQLSKPDAFLRQSTRLRTPSSSSSKPTPAIGAEPPRVSRRVICLSQAAIADSCSWW